MTGVRISVASLFGELMKNNKHKDKDRYKYKKKEQNKGWGSQKRKQIKDELKVRDRSDYD